MSRPSWVAPACIAVLTLFGAWVMLLVADAGGPPHHEATLLCRSLPTGEPLFEPTRAEMDEAVPGLAELIDQIGPRGCVDLGRTEIGNAAYQYLAAGTSTAGGHHGGSLLFRFEGGTYDVGHVAD